VRKRLAGVGRNTHQLTVSDSPTTQTVEASGDMMRGLMTSLCSSSRGIARARARKKRHKVVRTNIMEEDPDEPKVDELLGER
jgi:hypothetical protein